MPRTLAQINADIAKFEELRDTHTPDPDITGAMIEEELANLRTIKQRKLDRRAEQRAERLAELDADEAIVNAMLLEPDLSQFVTRRLERFLLRLDVLRDDINRDV
jgi:hypothetical protein